MSLKVGVPTDRRLTDLPDPTDVQFFTKQLQNTHSVMNQIKNQDKRQGQLKRVSNQFGVLSSKLDTFRDQLFHKLSELHMSLERPKIAFEGPGPMSVSPLADPLVSNNRYTNAVIQNFTPLPQKPISAPSYVSMSNNYKTVSPSFAQMSMASLNGPLSSMRSQALPPMSQSPTGIGMSQAPVGSMSPGFRRLSGAPNMF